MAYSASPQASISGHFKSEKSTALAGGTNERRLPQTEEAGNYRFSNPAVGTDYIVTPLKARYNLSPNSKFILLVEDLAGTDFAVTSSKN